jgi:hypothetical protein
MQSSLLTIFPTVPAEVLAMRDARRITGQSDCKDIENHKGTADHPYTLSGELHRVR